MLPTTITNTLPYPIQPTPSQEGAFLDEVGLHTAVSLTKESKWQGQGHTILIPLPPILWNQMDWTSQRPSVELKWLPSQLPFSTTSHAVPMAASHTLVSLSQHAVQSPGKIGTCQANPAYVLFAAHRHATSTPKDLLQLYARITAAQFNAT